MKKEADWIGKRSRRFSLLRLRWEWGRWHYVTNCCGDTPSSWWVVEDVYYLDLTYKLKQLFKKATGNGRSK